MFDVFWAIGFNTNVKRRRTKQHSLCHIHQNIGHVKDQILVHELVTRPCLIPLYPWRVIIPCWHLHSILRSSGSRRRSGCRHLNVTRREWIGDRKGRSGVREIQLSVLTYYQISYTRVYLYQIPYHIRIYIDINENKSKNYKLLLLLLL